MASPDSNLSDEALLERVTEALCALHERHHGRQPAAARSVLIEDELLACVMGGVYTEVEKTLIEIQRRHLVHDARGEFQHAMQDRLVGTVERLTGRPVETFISSHHVGPDLEIELFFLGPPSASTLRSE